MSCVMHWQGGPSSHSTQFVWTGRTKISFCTLVHMLFIFHSLPTPSTSHPYRTVLCNASVELIPREFWPLLVLYFRSKSSLYWFWFSHQLVLDEHLAMIIACVLYACTDASTWCFCRCNLKRVLRPRVGVCVVLTQSHYSDSCSTIYTSMSTRTKCPKPFCWRLCNGMWLFWRIWTL